MATLICLRYFLIGGAIVVGICGVVESVFAGYFIYQLHEYGPLTPNDVCNSSVTLLVMGLLTCLMGWCFWQFLDFTNSGQVFIFSVALIVITMVNLSAGIWALVRHEQVVTLSPAHLKQVFELATTDNKPLWDHMQTRLGCCGIDGPSDYRDYDAVPWSCCDIPTFLHSNDSKGICTNMYARGCLHIVVNRTRSILLHVFLLALCTVSLQVCFTICSICYARVCRERRERKKKERKLMMHAHAFPWAAKELENKDNLLTCQS